MPSQSSSRDRPPYEPPAMFAGKYAIRRVLGEGGMAVVYAAVDTTCDRQVAIKVLRPSAAAHRHLSSARVRREAATVVKLHERTPHVVEVLTAGVSEDEHRLPYYVMERLTGTTLREDIENRRRGGRPYDCIEVVGIVTEIALALMHAHDMGVVHRDVKPENVFIAEQRDRSTLVKLLDFGVSALLADEEEERGRRRAFSGSRQYAAPEQLDGKPPAPACDVYAVGLILFEMLTFTLPHDRMNRALSIPETALNVLREPLPDLHKLRPDIPPRLEILVRNCLAYDPEWRPNALQLANMSRDIKRVLESKLVGGNETHVTDVSGPPPGVIAERFGTTSGSLAREPALRMEGVDPYAATDPGAAAIPSGAVPADHEVFFMNPVAGETARMRTVVDATLVPPTLVSPAPNTLPLDAPGFDPRMLAQPPAMSTQPIPKPVLPQPIAQAAPVQPTWGSSHSVEPFASRTQPHPGLPSSQPRLHGPLAFAAALLLVSVGVLGLAARKALQHSLMASPTAASMNSSVAVAVPPAPVMLPEPSADSIPTANLLADPPAPSASTSSSQPSSPSKTAPAASTRPHPHPQPSGPSRALDRPSAGF